MKRIDKDTSFLMDQVNASFYEGKEIRIDCFTPSIGIHIYVNIR